MEVILLEAFDRLGKIGDVVKVKDGFARNFLIPKKKAIKATEAGYISLSQDQRTFTYGDGNRKLMTVPFDENPYSALAAFFKTDEGVEVYKAIQKKLK